MTEQQKQKQEAILQSARELFERAQTEGDLKTDRFFSDTAKYLLAS